MIYLKFNTEHYCYSVIFLTQVNFEQNGKLQESMKFSDMGPNNTQQQLVDGLMFNNHGVTYLSRAATPSSNRKKAAFIRSTVKYELSSKHSQRRKTLRAKHKQTKQCDHLINVEVPSEFENVIHSDDLKNTILFVDGGAPSNPPIHPTIPTKDNRKNKTIRVLRIRNGDLYVPKEHMLCHDMGLVYKKSGSPSVFILVPRIDSLKWTGIYTNKFRSAELCDAFDGVESCIRASQERGGKKHVMREKDHKYCCVGNQTRRAGTGIRKIHYALSNANVQHTKIILKYFRSVEHLFESYVDTDQVRLIHDALDLVDASTFTIPQEDYNRHVDDKSRIYGAYASGVNVYLNAHDDLDYTYSATSVHMKQDYKNNDSVVAYFTFPCLGIALPLRPGDVLFFNPREPHCISSRCKNEDDIYCVSLYIKSDSIGLNDNSRELEKEEEQLLHHYNKYYTNK